MWVRILDRKPNLHIALQSALDCSEATGLVNSIWNVGELPIRWLSSDSAHVVHTEIIQRPCDLDLLLGIEKGVGKLFALP